MDIENIKDIIDNDLDSLSYDTLLKYGKNNLKIFIDKCEGYYIDEIGKIVINFDNEIFSWCVLKNNYLIEEIDIKDFDQFEDLLKKIIPDYPDIIKKFDINLFKKYDTYILQGLMKKPKLLEYCPEEFMFLHEKEIIDVVERFSKMIVYVPKKILLKYPKKVVLFIKRKPEILKYIDYDIQDICSTDLINIVRNNPVVFGYLSDKIKSDKLLFEECLNKLYPDLDDKQIGLVYEMLLQDNELLYNFKPYMVARELIDTLDLKVIARLIKQKDIVLAIGKLKTSKFKCFCKMLSLYKESSFIEEKILLLVDALNNGIEIIDVIDNRAKKGKKIANKVIIKELSEMVETELTNFSEVDIKRLAYVYLKYRGVICCDNLSDFFDLDKIRSQMMKELLTDKFLTFKEAKNIIYEFKYGFSYDEVNILLWRYGREIDKLLSFYDKKKLSLDELDEKQLLLDLKKMQEISEISNINSLKEEMNFSLINYKGENKIYDEFLYFEDNLKLLFNKRTIKEISRSLDYSNVYSIKYEDLVDLSLRKERYLGKKVTVKEVSYNQNFNILVSVLDGNRKTIDKKYIYGLKDRLNDNQDDLSNKVTCSLIGDNYCGLVPLYYKDGKRKVIMRYKDLESGAIVAQSSNTFNFLGRIDVIKSLKESVYLTPVENIYSSRNVCSDYVINLIDSNNKKVMPSSLIAFETIDSYLIEAAIDLNLSIELIDRRRSAIYQRDLIDILYNKYMNYLNSDYIYVDTNITKRISRKDCFRELIRKFSSLRVGFKNSDLKKEMLTSDFLLFNDKKLTSYIDSILEELEKMIEVNKDKALNELMMIKSVLEEEYFKVNVSNGFSKDRRLLSFDRKSILRKIDRLGRLMNIDVSDNKFKLKIFDDLNEGLSLFNKNYNYNWSCFGKQFDYEDISSDILGDFINEALNLAYQNGLYRGKTSHDPGHIERCSIYASILAKRLFDDEVISKMSILAAIFHDSGRIGERNEKHGDYSASIARKLLNKFDFSKDDINIVCAAIDFHDEDNSFLNMLSIYIKKYHLKDFVKFEKVAKILKDADALDRLRFIGPGTLEVKYLNYDMSRNLIKIAALLNEKNAMNKLKCLISKSVIKKKYLDNELDNGRLPQEILYEVERENGKELRGNIYDNFKILEDEFIPLEQ